jgi:hypothetical protein
MHRDFAAREFAHHGSLRGIQLGAMRERGLTRKGRARLRHLSYRRILKNECVLSCTGARLRETWRCATILRAICMTTTER